MNRIISLFLFSFVGCIPSSKVSDTISIHVGTDVYFNPALKPFYHGVASGDPTANSVLIWTRFTPDKAKDVFEIEWEMALDPYFSNIIDRGSSNAFKENDYTVTVSVDSLMAQTHYFYRFAFENIYSSTGRTRTAPSGRSSELRFAIISCSNFEAGYYNALARISEIPDLDAVIHLGDYIYEYPPDYYGDKSLARKHLPRKEIITLSDYRTRYAQYRLDKDFQRIHQMHPFIVIWDDHEISNNSYQTGAENHDEISEGPYAQRKAAARKAYEEWLPVKLQEQGRLYRKLEYGDLVDWIMLDERLAGRSMQVKADTSTEYTNPQRTMLGAVQLDWFEHQLSNSEATWKLIGNQVIFSDVTYRNMDAWDGYPVEKDQIIDFILNTPIQDVVFLTGDTHRSWAFEVPIDIESYKNQGPVVAFEFGTPSITSANSNESNPDSIVIEQEESLLEENPHLKYANMRDHGYILLTVRKTEIIAEWYYMEAINRPNIKQYLGKKLRILRGGRHIIK